MKRDLCVLCKRIHKSYNWHYGPYETVEGERYGWFCDKWFTPSRYPEFVPESIKEERKEYSKALLQPYRQGIASQEYIDSYGTKRINPKDVKKSKKVWGDILPFGWEKSK